MPEFWLPIQSRWCHTVGMTSARALTLCVAGSLILGFTPFAPAQGTIKKEIDVSFAPLEVIKPILDAALTPQGRFVMLARKGGVLVIDTPEGVMAAEQAVGRADLSKAEVTLEFQFVTGLPQRQTTITAVQEVPFPVEFAPPAVRLGPKGVVVVIPATPTKFQARNIGVTSDTVSTFNPDGTVTLDIKTQSSQFEGFVNYGSALLPSGGIGGVPVNGQVGDPNFFSPYANSGAINVPIISTTRISTSVVIRPRLELGIIHLDMMPRLELDFGGAETDPHLIDLQQFRTTLPIQNHQIGRVYGFAGADDAFHRHFFGARDLNHGSVSIVVKASAAPPQPKPVAVPPISPAPPAVP